MLYVILLVWSYSRLSPVTISYIQGGVMSSDWVEFRNLFKNFIVPELCANKTRLLLLGSNLHNIPRRLTILGPHIDHDVYLSDSLVSPARFHCLLNVKLKPSVHYEISFSIIIQSRLIILGSYIDNLSQTLMSQFDQFPQLPPIIGTSCFVHTLMLEDKGVYISH